MYELLPHNMSSLSSEQIHQEAFARLEVYANLARYPVILDANEIDGQEYFLKPIQGIFNALRSYFGMPSEAASSLEEQVVIHNVESSNNPTLALELIDFTSRLQQAIVTVEANPFLTTDNYTALHWQFLHPLYKSCEHVIKANFWPIHPLVENLRWIIYDITTPTDANSPRQLMAESRRSLITSLAYTLMAYYVEASKESKEKTNEVILMSYSQLLYPLQLELLDLINSSAVQSWLQRNYPNENSADLLNLLRHHRNVDGSSAQQVLDYQAWLGLANQLFLASEEDTARNNTVCLRLRDIRTISDKAQIHQAEVVEYPIKPAVYQQFLEQNAQGEWTFKPKVNTVGRHNVYPLRLMNDITSRPAFWMKFLPEQSGIEFAIYRLAERLGLGGVVPGLIGNIRLNGKDNGQAVWISPDVGWQSEQPGLIKNLAEVVENEPELLNKIDRASLTRAILRVLWSNPEDDKGNDYFLIPFMKNGEIFYRIVRIDVERAFFPVERQETIAFGFSQTILQVKSLLYCLAQMQQPLDEEVLKEFAALDMYQVLKAWVDELQLEHQRYKELFTEAEIHQHFSKDNSNITILAVMLHEKLMPELLGRLQLIQHTIRDVIESKKTLTGLALLHCVQPTLVSKGQAPYQYAKAFTIYPAASQVKERFNVLTKKQYDATHSQTSQVSATSAALAAQQSLRLERSLTVADVLECLEDKRLSPSQAKAQLERLASVNASEIWHDLLSYDTTLQSNALAKFGELPIKQRATLITQVSKNLAKNPGVYSKSQQELILEAIARTNWQTLTLSVFADTLTPKRFQKIIEKTASSLVNLDISKCHQLGENDIALIAQHFFLLECLDISGIPIRQLRINAPWSIESAWFDSNSTLMAGTIMFGRVSRIKVDPTWFTSLALPKLKVLTARYCQSLELIDIQLPVLKRLEVEKSQRLRDIKAVAPTSARALLPNRKFSHKNEIQKLLSMYGLWSSTADNELIFILKAFLPLTSMGDMAFFERLCNFIPNNIKPALYRYAYGESLELVDLEGRVFVPNAQGKEAIVLSKPMISTFVPKEEELVLRHAAVIILLQLPINRLDFSHNKIGDRGAELLSQGLQNNSALTILDLSDNQISNKGAKFLSQALEENSSLITLILLNNEIGGEGGSFLLQALYSNRGLLKLYIWPANSDFTEIEDKIEVILTFHRARMIRKIPLDQPFNPTPITPSTPTIQLPSLSAESTSLNLSNTSMKMTQLIDAGKTYTHLALTRLILTKNAITTEGIKLLAQELIPKLLQLSYLDLSENSFDEFGLAALVKAFTKWKLLIRHLDVSGNTIGDSGMQVLADYLCTTISLQFLGIRDTSFSESVGYPRFIDSFKRNYTVVTVDTRGNLLLSSAAPRLLTEVLKRNSALQPTLLALQKEQAHYLATLEKYTEQICQLLDRKEVRVLNAVYALLQKLHQLWQDKIERAYNFMKDSLKKQGNNESHPLLALLSEARKQQQALSEKYQQVKFHLSQPDHNADWQRNRVTIRIWLADISKAQVGHVSVATTRSYLSFWPNQTPSFYEIITGSGVKAAFHSLVDDEKAEGSDVENNNIKWAQKRRKVADKIIVFFSLNSQEIEQRIQILFNLGNEYSLMSKRKVNNSQQSDEYKQLGNCCDKVSEVIGSQLELLTGNPISQQFGIATPFTILSWAETAKQAELSHYPHTNGFNTLRSEEQTPSTLYPSMSCPSEQQQKSYSEKGLFFGYKRLPNTKLGTDLTKQWLTTSNPTFVANSSYQTLHDEELELQEGDLIEDLTPIMNTSDFKTYLPDANNVNVLGTANLPGWVHFKQVRSATVALEDDITKTQLKKDMTLKVIGKNGSLDDDNCVIICQKDSVEGLSMHSLHRREVRFVK